MKKLFFTLLLAATTMGVFAVPAYRGWRTLTQPDGTSITARLVGDEFYHFWQDENGNQVKQDENGYWQVVGATPNAPTAAKQRFYATNLRRQESKINAPNKVGRATTSLTKGVVILVNYKDVSMKSGNTLTEFQDMMMNDAYSFNSNYPGSAHKYFYDQSNGQYNPQFDVYGPYTLDNNRAYYGANDPDNNDNDVRSEYMIRDACVKANADIDFSKYDLDNDGFVDFVYVFYAGNGEADSDVEDAVWPHSWNLYKSAGITQTCDGKKIDLYACSSELNGNNQRAGIATFCHEFSHVIGMPDYYDIDYGNNYKNGLTPMEWTLMDGGSYNGDGYCPPNYSAFDKYYMGWNTPTILNTAQNVTLTTGYADCYQINANGSLATYNASTTQYYIENRQKSGWDKALPGHGMLVWKVMYNQTAWNNNGPNDANGTIRYGVLCADGGHKHIKSGGYDYWEADDGDTYPGTSHVLNINSTAPFTTYPITNIAESAGNITFKFMGGGTLAKYEYSVDAENCTVSSTSGEIESGKTLTLTITPNSGYKLTEDCWLISMGQRDLDYGTDYTYSNGTLTIYNVTNEVTVVVIPIEIVNYTITWLANGETFATKSYEVDEPLELPEDEPAACANEDVFVGWTSIEGYSNPSLAPSFIKGGDPVTKATTYYAVYATRTSGEESQNITFNFAELAESRGWTNGTAYTSVTYDKVTLTANGGGDNGKYYDSNDTWRMYNGGTLVITSEEENITAVSSEPEKTFTISNGEATLHFSTTTKFKSITVTLGNAATYENYSTICSNEIHKKNPTSSFATASKNMTVGQTFTQTVTTNADGDVSYSSSNTAVATVNASTGEVKAVGAGQTTITATIADGTYYNADEASYSVNVSKNSGNASFSETQADFEYGTLTSFQHQVTTSSTGEVSYSSSNTAVATVANDGTVTILKPGTVTITANVAATQSTEAGEASYTFTVRKHPVEASFQQSAYTMPKDADNFTPIFTHNSANNAQVTFSSSNTTAATVNTSTGEVDVLEVGQTTITATVAANDYYEGATATCTIDVVKAADKVTISFVVNGVTVQTGQQAVGLPLALPANPKYPHFAGWTAQDNYFNLTDKPADLFTATDGKTVPTKATTYYAVFHPVR